VAGRRRFLIPVLSGRAITAGDLLVASAFAAVVLATALPALRHRSFAAELARAEEAVEALRAGAERRLTGEGSWPASAEPGVIPPDLADGFLRDTQLTGNGWSIQWTRWEVVDSVPAPPPPVDELSGDAPPRDTGPALEGAVRTIGAITVHAAEGRLLGELLARAGRERSFVRDTTWTLVLPSRGRIE